MPTTLSPTQQLTAAQNQYNTWYKQQIASGNSPTISEANQQKAAILNSGAYPALDAGIHQLNQSQGLNVNVTPDSFFIVGEGGNYTPDRSSGYSGEPLLTNNGFNAAAINDTNSVTIQQVADAQAAAMAAQDAQQQALNSGSAEDAANAQSALAAAQARVAALQAQVDSNNTQASAVTGPIVAANSGNPVIQNTPQLNPGQVAMDAATATNSQLGTPITQQESNPIAQASAAQVAAQETAVATASTRQQAELAQQQAQNAAENTNNVAQSNNNGTASARQQAELAQTLTTNNDTQITPSQGTNANNGGAVEDAAGASGTNNALVTTNSNNQQVYSDQTSTNQNNVPSTGKPGEDNMSQSSASTTSSGKATGGTSASTAGGTAGGASGNGNATNQFPSSKGNPLHDYVNHTYKISIYAVPTDNINITYNSGLAPGNENALIQGGYFVLSDGGAGASGGASRTYFPTDLGIDNVELETIVGNDNRTRGTDVVRIKFEVIEPYTNNFLGRLQQVAVAINGNNANWSNTFFVMVIDFYGYDDLGKPQKIKGTTKYIPFTFTKMKMKITASGGRYTVDAIPVHSLASTVLDNQIPFHVEIQASTIAELFNATAENYTTTTTALRANSADQELRTTTQQQAPVTNDTTVTKGLADALNLAEAQKCLPDAGGKRVGQELPNMYNFIFDQALLQATIADVGKFTEQSVAMAKPGDATVKQQASTGSLTIDLTKKKFNAQAGTKITDFINSVLSISSYMTDQNTSSGQDSQTVNTWKITPSIKFGAIDKGTGFYQRTVTYHVTPYVMSGHDAPGFGQKTVDPKEIVKQYLYTYSGLNKDVLDVNLEYNAAFFEIRNAKPGNQKQSNDNPGNQGNPADGTFTGAYDASTDNRFFKPKYHYVRGIANRQNTSATTLDDKTIAVQNLMEKLYDNMGDMFKLDITIVGDPDWISQDSTLYGPGVGASPYLPGTNGSINFMKPAYFNFYFATPNQDYDDVSGLFNSNLTYSQFSGIFQVSAVTTSFSGGKFTQKLKNYRVRNQIVKSSSSSRTDSVSGSAATSGNSANPVAEASKQNVNADGAANSTLNQGKSTTSPSSQTAVTTAPNSGVSEDAAPTP